RHVHATGRVHRQPQRPPLRARGEPEREAQEGHGRRLEDRRPRREQVTPRRVVLVLVAACLGAGSSEARTFKDVFRGARPTPSPTIVLGNALADTVARSLPLTSASSGLTFRYDASSGAFVRDTDLLGQLYLERARPIGRGKWNVTVSYQRVNVDSVQGQDLDELSHT